MHRQPALCDLSPIFPLAARELAILRLLGRLGMVTGPTVHTLICPDMAERSGRHLLFGLAERKLIWKGSTPNTRTDGRLHGRPPRIYGLTEDGKQFLESMGAEPHDGTFERLIARAKPGPTPPLATHLHYDFYISEWVASLLDQVRRIPQLAGVEVQRRYGLVEQDGTALQTIGALITLAFDRSQTTYMVAPPAIPWLSDGAIAASWWVIRLALEVDTGLTPARSIYELAQTYRALHERSAYQRLLGGPLVPVIITSPGRRLKTVATVWMSAWPGSPALLSSTERTASPDYGVLWGSYMAMKTDPVQAASLLGSMLGTVAQWPARIAPWPELRPAKGAGASNDQRGPTSSA